MQLPSLKKFFESGLTADMERILESIPLIIAVIDPNLNYVFANSAYVQAVNSDCDTWVGKKVDEYLPPHLIEYVFPRLNRALKGVEGVKYNLDIKSESESGQIRRIQVNYYPIVAAQGFTKFILMTGTDMTELSAAKRRMMLFEELEVVSLLSGGVVHDFNNYLGVIIGNIDLLKSNVTDLNDLQRLEAISEMTMRSANLVSKILAFNGRKTHLPEWISAAEAVSSMADLAKATLPSLIKFSMDFQCEADGIFVDSIQLETALLNLIINARDSMPEGGEVVISTRDAIEKNQTWSPKIESDSDSNAVLIEIIDQGVGMSDAVSDMAFQPYFTTKSAKQGGGMGLSMIYDFVKQSGGHINLITAPGLGTTAQLFFPCASHADELIKKVELTSPTTVRRLRIMVVEDYKEIAVTISEMIESLGHVAVICEDAKCALENLLKGEKFDVVFSDIELKKVMAGIELHERLKRDMPQVRVILTSGYIGGQPESYSTINSEVEFVAKPVSLDVLRKLLNETESASSHRKSVSSN